MYNLLFTFYLKINNCFNSKQLAFTFLFLLSKLSLGSTWSWFWKGIFDNEFRTYTKHKSYMKASNVEYYISFLLAPCTFLHSRLYASILLKAENYLRISVWIEWLSGLCSFEKLGHPSSHFCCIGVSGITRWTKERYKTDPYWQSASTSTRRNRSGVLLTFSLTLIPLSLHALSFAWTESEKKINSFVGSTQKKAFPFKWSL